MKVLLTGATGFIGKAALDCLLAHGHKILVLSRHAAPEVMSESLQWQVADLLSVGSYYDAVSAFRPEACLHLAWQGIPDYSLGMGLINVEAGARLVEALLKLDCKHFVVSGSCWEYGKVSGCVREDSEPVEVSVFGACKHALHHLTAALCRPAQATLAWGRVFYPYGPGQKAISLAPTICQAIAAGQLPLLKTPGVMNDFLYVNDTAEALVVLIEKMAHGVFNIGSGSGTPVGTLANELLVLAGREPVFACPTATGSPGFWADSSRLRALGWEPQTPLVEGLRSTLKYFAGQSGVC